MCIDNIQTNSLTSITSNKTFNFSFLYTTIPHDKLKFKLASIVKQALLTTSLSIVELAWRSGSVMDCHATERSQNVIKTGKPITVMTLPLHLH